MKAPLVILIDPSRGSAVAAIGKALREAGVSHEAWMFGLADVRVIVVPRAKSRKTRRLKK